MGQTTEIALFEQKQIRQIQYNGETYFSVVDIIEVLTESINPRDYWKKIKKRETQLGTNCPQLKLKAADGKFYKTDCANTEGVLRIIQSVPSPKAEPFKTWMASLGTQAIQEAFDPELLTEKQAELYRAKGYSEEWITRRLKTIEVRKGLTDEWQKRGVKEGEEYGILTATIAKGTFGLNPSEHAKHKNLNGQNLRDHMSNMELILTALSEEATKIMTVDDDAQGFNENHEAAVKGGKVGKKALQNFEKIAGRKVVSEQNFLETLENKPLPNSEE